MISITMPRTTLPEEDPAKQLLYLASFSEDSCPFTEDQKKLFEETAKVIEVADRWLKFGLWGTTLLSILPVAAFPIISYVRPVVRWTQKNPVNSLYITLILTTLSAGTNWINFVATGIYPDQSATAKTARSEQLQETCKIYEHIGSHLILYPRTVPLDFPRIEKSMAQWIPRNSAKKHLIYLQEAVEYVNTGKEGTSVLLPIEIAKCKAALHHNEERTRIR